MEAKSKSVDSLVPSVIVGSTLGIFGNVIINPSFQFILHSVEVSYILCNMKSLVTPFYFNKL
jgi:hypothetical protein